MAELTQGKERKQEERKEGLGLNLEDFSLYFPSRKGRAYREDK